MRIPLSVNELFSLSNLKEKQNKESPPPPRLPFLNIFSGANVVKKPSITANFAREGCKNQLKSIEFVTSCNGHVDQTKNVTDEYSSITFEKQMKLFRQEVDGHLQLMM